LTTNSSENWSYQQPVEIWFGEGSINRLADAVKKIGGSHGIVITSRSFAQTAERLKENPENHIDEVYHEVRPNPELRFTEECADRIRTHQLDFVIALGGGSVLDSAKAAAAVSTEEKSIRHYFGTGNPLPSKGIPVIAVPTTAGTGSEVTSVSVLSDGNRKLPLSASSLTARIAVIDPELTLSLPAYLTACTGMDALCHAIEGYSSINHQPICDTLAIRAAGLVLSNLETAVRNGSDRDARRAMAEASVLAGLSFAIPKTTGPHACSYPLTAQYGIPHGEACGLTLDWFLQVNRSITRIQTLANALGFSDVTALADHIGTLRRTIGLRTTLADLHLSAEQIDRLAQDSVHPNLYNNPVLVTIEMLKEMYTKLAR
jgi:alcohol dehydrogenase